MVDECRDKRDFLDSLPAHRRFRDHRLARMRGEVVLAVRRETFLVDLVPDQVPVEDADAGTQLRRPGRHEIPYAVEADLAFVHFDRLDRVRMVADDEIGTGIDRAMGDRLLVCADRFGNVAQAPVQRHDDHIGILPGVANILLHRSHVLLVSLGDDARRRAGLELLGRVVRVHAKGRNARLSRRGRLPVPEHRAI